ncbi:MAG: GUN4 domain-containing protein [Cyanobacteria bacterium J06592_8]
MHLHHYGHFGFSTQKKIWEAIGGKSDADYETWEKFGKEIGWYYNESQWKNYISSSFTLETEKAHLPAHWTTRSCDYGFPLHVFWGLVFELNSSIGIDFTSVWVALGAIES